MTLKIFQWNCHSLYQRLSHFKLKLYSLKPHIACLCETWIKENYLPKFINYSSFFSNRSCQIGGGLAMLVRNDVCVKTKSINLFYNGLMVGSIFFNKKYAPYHQTPNSFKQ